MYLVKLQIVQNESFGSKGSQSKERLTLVMNFNANLRNSSELENNR